MQVNLGKIFFIQRSSFLWSLFYLGTCPTFLPSACSKAVLVSSHSKVAAEPAGAAEAVGRLSWKPHAQEMVPDLQCWIVQRWRLSTCTFLLKSAFC